MKTASKCSWRNPTNINALKLKKAQIELANTYLQEQTEYIKIQINNIRDSVEDRPSRKAWQTVNEVNRRALRKLNWKLLANNEYNYRNNISRIYSETLWKLHMSQLRELFVNN